MTDTLLNRSTAGLFLMIVSVWRLGPAFSLPVVRLQAGSTSEAVLPPAAELLSQRIPNNKQTQPFLTGFIR